MRHISIFNDVLGPVMRGPSSSHTAGSFHIARLAVDLLGARPAVARFAFDPGGSYAQVYREQGVDRAFAMGLLGWPLADQRFMTVLDLAPVEGLELHFGVRPLQHADHPNTVEIELRATAHTPALRIRARSVGGGSVEIVSVDGWPVRITGETWEVLAETAASSRALVAELLSRDGQVVGDIRCEQRAGVVLLHARRYAPLPSEIRQALAAFGLKPAAAADVHSPSSAVEPPALPLGALRELRPLAFVKRGPALFASGSEMVKLTAGRSLSLGRLAIAHEASLLGIGEPALMDEMLGRLDVMVASVSDGLEGRHAPMQLLEPSAKSVYEAEAAGRVAIGGLHTRAAARALAAMHVNSGMGVVCAAPTGGSSGVLPGVITTLVEEKCLRRGSARAGSGLQPETATREEAARALFAAGAIGVVVASRATFAAEEAGCQVEIGAAGAMAAAAVVEAAGGTADQAADAAAISFQNTMGSVCDLVQGMVEIPCHTRNAVAASSAFVCADLMLGGYRNPIPLDDTVDAVLATGRMLPCELRCTARGGLAITPSALALRGPQNAQK